MRPFRTIRAPVMTTGLLAVFIALPSPCAGEWRRIDSPNFAVVGDVRAGRSGMSRSGSKASARR